MSEEEIPHAFSSHVEDCFFLSGRNNPRRGRIVLLLATPTCMRAPHMRNWYLMKIENRGRGPTKNIGLYSTRTSELVTAEYIQTNDPRGHQPYLATAP